MEDKLLQIIRVFDRTNKLDRNGQTGLPESEEDHQKLIDKYGAEKTAQFYEHLSLWKQTQPENKLKSLINGDYARINKWVVASPIEKSEIEQHTLNISVFKKTD